MIPMFNHPLEYIILYRNSNRILIEWGKLDLIHGNYNLEFHNEIKSDLTLMPVQYFKKSCTLNTYIINNIKQSCY